MNLFAPLAIGRTAVSAPVLWGLIALGLVAGLLVVLRRKGCSWTALAHGASWLGIAWVGMLHGAALYEVSHRPGASARALWTHPTEAPTTCPMGRSVAPRLGTDAVVARLLTADTLEFRLYDRSASRAQTRLRAWLETRADMRLIGPVRELPFSRRRQVAWSLAAGFGACAVGLFWGRWLEGSRSVAGVEDEEDEPTEDAAED